ncbi:putative F-box domain-containing protein [Medicago truncatula]|uniref:Putative F-box domain-containing protein n=1 Tax=Medicago truncatula TaxID=3880 RepID=A0A396IRF7_MEDTR|nr:putative F-box domain-containing protein [Medicago truncatula]
MKLSCTKKAKGESTTKPNWLELPIDLMKNILQRLDTVEIVTSARNVCSLWRNICKDPLMWRTIHMICRFNFSSSCMEKICA